VAANARANYIISAQDATKDAIRSIEKNFKSLDSGVKTAVRGINLTFGVLAGAGLKNLFRSSLEATAEATGANSEFSKTLDDVKKSAQALLVPKSGLPGVTENMKELAETLKDPAVTSAADALFSAILRGGSAAVKVLAETAAGLRIIATGKGGNEAVDIDMQIERLEKERTALQKSMQSGSFGNESSSMASMEFYSKDNYEQDERRVRAIGTEIYGLRQMYYEALRGDAGKGLQSITSTGEANSNLLDMIEAQSKGFVQAQDAAAEYAKTVKELADLSEKLPGMTSETIMGQFNEVIEQQQHAIDAQRELTEQAEQAQRQQEKNTAQWRERMEDEAKRAAQETHDAWTDALLTIEEDGMDGLYRKWKQTMKLIVAEAGASGFLSLLHGGSFFGGFSDGLGSAIGKVGKLFGFANGGDFTVGGSGGTDSQLVAFRATPGEAVSIRTPGQSRSTAGAVAVHMHNDFRGATVDAVKYFQSIAPALVRQAIDGARMAVRDDLSRGAYA
jgi:hypothetical protein